MYALISSDPLVGIIMGSGSDWEKVKPATKILKEFGVPFECGVKSAHRTPERMEDYALAAHIRSIRVIIAAAGGAAHLPGMVASYTPLPVIGLPIPSSLEIDGQAAMSSMIQMPNGVPVATVGLGRAKNAALLAIKILGVAYPILFDRLLEYRAGVAKEVIAEDEALSNDWENYVYTPPKF